MNFAHFFLCDYLTKKRIETDFFAKTLEIIHKMQINYLKRLIIEQSWYIIIRVLQKNTVGRIE